MQIQPPRELSQVSVSETLAEELVCLFPFWPCTPLDLLFRNQLLQIQISPARHDIHVARPHDLGLIKELIDHVEYNDDRKTEVGLEERLCLRPGANNRIPAVRCDRGEADPELGDKDQDIKDEPNPATNNTGLRTKGKIGE